MNCVICGKPSVALWGDKCAACLSRKDNPKVASEPKPIGVALGPVNAVGGYDGTAGEFVYASRKPIDTLSQLRVDKKKAQEEIKKIMNDLQKKYKDVEFELNAFIIAQSLMGNSRVIEVELTSHM